VAGAFDRLEGLVNAAINQHLTNRMVTINGVSCPAIFDNEFVVGYSNTGAEIATTEPQIQVLSSNVPTSAIGKTVVVDSKNYVIKSNQPDGTGWSLLKLERS
jgi:hypothetical protein